jgi:hypothetical protein
VSVDRRSSEQRAQRLLRWYPRGWRERYGEEFAELLIADLDERPQCRRRTADTAAHGLVARLAVGGLGDSPLGRPQAALATVAVAMIGFAACGMSLWSQLLVGWRWSPPDSAAVTTGVVVMSAAAAYLAVIAVLAAAPVIAAVARAVRGGDARPLVGPTVLLVAGAAVLAVGGHHFLSAWPGHGGHQWRFQRLVPSSIAGFGWSETLGISAYWAHPADLLALPTAELAWMLTSPVVLVAAVAGAVQLVRRVTLSGAALAYEARLARAATVGMLPCLAAAGWWVISSRSGASDVFRAGSLDLLLIAGMAVAVLVASAAMQRVHRVA